MTIQTIVWGAPSFWIERLPVLIGLERGFFAKRDVLPKLEIFHGGPELLRAVEEGRVPVGEIGLPPFIRAFGQGQKIRLIGGTFIQKLDHFLAARPEIGSLAELRGRKVGILSKGSCDQFFLRRLLSSAGLEPDRDVETVPLGRDYGRMENFSSGRIDASFVVEPYLSQAEDQGLVRVLARVGDYFPRYQWGGVFAAAALVEEYPDLLAALMDGYREATAFMIDRPRDCLALGAREFKVSEKVFERALSRHLPNADRTGRLDFEGLQNCLCIQQELGAASAGLFPGEMAAQM
ncbi:MAG: ABC transporter substrate-binding protein [Pseudomonadota bacterium]